jgi:TolA-binding protein
MKTKFVTTLSMSLLLSVCATAQNIDSNENKDLSKSAIINNPLEKEAQEKAKIDKVKAEEAKKLAEKEAQEKAKIDKVKAEEAKIDKVKAEEAKKLAEKEAQDKDKAEEEIVVNPEKAYKNGLNFIQKKDYKKASECMYKALKGSDKVNAKMLIDYYELYRY